MDSTHYEIQVTNRFKKDFQALENKLKDSIKKELEILKTNPYSCKRLHGNLKGFFSMRIGKYRIVYTIDEKSKTVILYFLGHRKGVYDRY